MGIQSSINSLLSQAQRITTFYKGYTKAKQFVGDQETTKNEAKIQTDIAAGLAPMKDGKVDPEWLKKQRDEFYKEAFNDDGTLTSGGEESARFIDRRVKEGVKLDSDVNEFYNNHMVQNYLKSYAAESELKRLKSAIDTLEPSIISQELKNEVARKVAKFSVKSRTNSINQAKSDFNAHTASLIKKYGKGSGNP